MRRVRGLSPLPILYDIQWQGAVRMGAEGNHRSSPGAVPQDLSRAGW